MSPRPDQIKAIHVLKSQAGLSEPDYRTHLKERFKVVSSKALTEGQAGALMDDLRALGGGKSRPASRRASGKFAPVLQALWIAGYNLGVVENADDAALLAFVKRQCKVDHDRFLTDGEDAAKAIEGLKSWIARESGLAWATKKDALPAQTLASVNKARVVYTIAQRLREHGLPGFDTESFACLERFPKPAHCNDKQLDKLAAKMGAMLRERLGRKG